VYSGKSVKKEYQTLVRTLHSSAPISGHVATRTINPHPDGHKEYSVIIQTMNAVKRFDGKTILFHIYIPITQDLFKYS
jgi:hypothetical protein